MLSFLLLSLCVCVREMIFYHNIMLYMYVCIVCVCACGGVCVCVGTVDYIGIDWIQ